jgi:Tfp pilus assembly protein PilN
VTQVNLLPPEIRQRHRSRQTAVLVAGAGGIVLALIFAFYVIQIGKLSGVNDDIAAQQQVNDQLTAQIAELQKFEDLQTRAQAKQALLDAAFADEVAFSGLLMDVSRGISTNQYLTSLNVQLNTGAPTDAGGGIVPPSAFVGTIAADGQTDSIETLATWLTRLGMVNGWVNPWVTTIDRSTQGGATVITFTGGTDLTRDIITERGIVGSAGSAGG